MDYSSWIAPVILILVGFALHISPDISRPGTFFTVTVDPELRRSPAGRSILRKYRVGIWIATALAAGYAAVRPHSWQAIPIFGLLAAATWATVSARRATLPFQVGQEAAPADFSTHPIALPGGWIGQLLPYLILAGSAVYLALNWDRIPERFPVHWGVGGQPDRWADKSLRGVYALPIIGVSVCAVMTFMSVAVSRSHRRALKGSAAFREAAFCRLNLKMLLGTALFIALLFGWLSVQLAIFSDARPKWVVAVPLIGSVVLVVAVLAAALRFSTDRDLSAGESDEIPDEAWKAGGMIYYNPADPALVVERRLGFGYTLNFARPAAWVALALTLVPVIVSILLVR